MPEDGAVWAQGIRGQQHDSGIQVVLIKTEPYSTKKSGWLKEDEDFCNDRQNRGWIIGGFVSHEELDVSFQMLRSLKFVLSVGDM